MWRTLRFPKGIWQCNCCTRSTILPSIHSLKGATSDCFSFTEVSNCSFYQGANYLAFHKFPSRMWMLTPNYHLFGDSPWHLYDISPQNALSIPPVTRYKSPSKALDKFKPCPAPDTQPHSARSEPLCTRSRSDSFWLWTALQRYLTDVQLQSSPGSLKQLEFYMAIQGHTFFISWAKPDTF